MRARLIPALLLIAALAFAPVAQARRHRDRCAVKHTHTVQVTKFVRVYERRPYIDDMGNDRVATYACHRYSGYKVRLDDQSGITVRAINRWWIAYVEDSQPGIDDERLTLHVFSVRDDLFTAEHSYGGDQQLPSVRNVVLRADGAAAWTATEDISNSAGWEVRATTGGPDDTLLDSGAGIDPGSLRLNGATVSWTNAGATRTAQLESP